MRRAAFLPHRGVVAKQVAVSGEARREEAKGTGPGMLRGMVFRGKVGIRRDANRCQKEGYGRNLALGR